ncbi:MAG: hypothetical protein WCX32_04005 [Clostridia bacterium]|jgi:hypothetical protein|nr:hypothetical protein [Clostridia bacterium]MDD4275736.1 hypothetical protein [Clostridia bacterium]
MIISNIQDFYKFYSPEEQAFAFVSCGKPVDVEIDVNLPNEFSKTIKIIAGKLTFAVKNITVKQIECEFLKAKSLTITDKIVCKFAKCENFECQIAELGMLKANTAKIEESRIKNIECDNLTIYNGYADSIKANTFFGVTVSINKAEVNNFRSINLTAKEVTVNEFKGTYSDIEEFVCKTGLATGTNLSVQHATLNGGVFKNISGREISSLKPICVTESLVCDSGYFDQINCPNILGNKLFANKIICKGKIRAKSYVKAKDIIAESINSPLIYADNIQAKITTGEKYKYSEAKEDFQIC